MTDRNTQTQIVRMLVGALVGGAFAMIAVKSGAAAWLRGMPADELASTSVAVAFLFLALFAIVVSSGKGIYRLMAANYREGDPLDAGVLRVLRRSGVAMLLSGVLLLAPPVAARMGAGETAAIAVAAAMAVLLLVSGWLSWRVARSGDELTRALAVETSAVSFWIATLALFGWAALVKLGLAAEIGTWTLMTIAMALNLVVQIGFAARRGLFA